jgi:hypothetical protein
VSPSASKHSRCSSWLRFLSRDFVDASARAIAISRLINSASEGWKAMMASFDLVQRSLRGDTKDVEEEYSRLAELPSQEKLVAIME